jgi:predicted Zn finger-like uncharacterized protein
MILTCPLCATRYLTDGRTFVPSGRNVRCAKCGHVWFQVPGGPETEPEPELQVSAPAPAASVTAMVPDAGFAAPSHRSSFASEFVNAVGWAALIILIFALGGGGVKYRQTIASLWPQSATLYAALGMPVNLRGIEIAGVSYRDQLENGEPVLAVSGRLFNVSGHELPVPRILVSLSDGDKRELYHWTFDANVATLAPGAGSDFMTRLASPPREARHVEVRFAGAGTGE